MRNVTRNPILVFAAFLSAFLLLLSADSSVVDVAVRAAIWALLLAMSGISVLKMIRHRRVHPYGQDATMPDPIRDWVLDDDDHPRRG